MWKRATRWFHGRSRARRATRIFLDASLPEGEGIVIEIALGSGACSGACGGACGGAGSGAGSQSGAGTDERLLADARLATVPSARHLRKVVRFCTRRKLPVAAWQITGLWRMPGRVEQIARWVSVLAGDAGAAQIMVDTGRESTGERMPERFERRLEGHLRRLGLEVCRTRLF